MTCATETDDDRIIETLRNNSRAILSFSSVSVLSYMQRRLEVSQSAVSRAVFVVSWVKKVGETGFAIFLQTWQIFDRISTNNCKFLTEEIMGFNFALNFPKMSVFNSHKFHRRKKFLDILPTGGARSEQLLSCPSRPRHHRLYTAGQKSWHRFCTPGSVATHLRCGEIYSDSLCSMSWSCFSKIFQTRSDDVIAKCMNMFNCLPVADAISRLERNFLSRFSQCNNFFMSSLLSCCINWVLTMDIILHFMILVKS